MKNWPRRARWGPTTRPPLRISQFVATKRPRPAMSPVTMPWTAALSRMSRVRASRSSVLSSFSIGGLLDELGEALEELEAGGGGGEGHPEEQGDVAPQGEGPRGGEARGRTTKQG